MAERIRGEGFVERPVPVKVREREKGRPDFLRGPTREKLRKIGDTSLAIADKRSDKPLMIVEKRRTTTMMQRRTWAKRRATVYGSSGTRRFISLLLSQVEQLFLDRLLK